MARQNSAALIVSYQTTDLAFSGTITNLEDINPADDVQDYRWIALENIDLDQFGLDSIRQIVALHCDATKHQP